MYPRDKLNTSNSGDVSEMGSKLDDYQIKKSSGQDFSRNGGNVSKERVRSNQIVEKNMIKDEGFKPRNFYFNKQEEEVRDN